MKRIHLLLAAAPLALAAPALAQEASPQSDAVEKEAPKEQAKEVFSTGVAKGRDRLDSATSTSVLKADEIQKLGARSLAEVLRNIPGLRVESSSGEGNSNYTIRGLPLASGGSKWLQIQEDGLPVMEFGDFFGVASDIFIRNDFNLGGVEAIRGGSASTFASNSPGGLINLISKTGDVEGGAVQLTTGLDYGEQRLDFDYGSKLNDTLRFHVGGFYRTGEGPRDIGFNGYRGGQIKFNVTKDLGSGFIRAYGKYLDDRSPQYTPVPVRIGGTLDKPTFQSFPNFDIGSDVMLSQNINSVITLDGNNQPSRFDTRDGMHAKVKSIGLETQFELAGWSISERARFSQTSGGVVRNLIGSVNTASAVATSLGGAGATLRYATGPLAGQAITNPSALNGNGLLAQMYLIKYDIPSLDNFTNDLRASRVWKLGDADLTTTAGVYKSLQTLNTNWLYTSTVQDVVGGGNAALVDVFNGAGVAQTQDGFNAFSLTAASGLYRRTFNVDYDITAPYGSVNYHIGKIAVGGSVRYDMGDVRGQLIGSELGAGRLGITAVDFNGDGVLSVAERRTALLPLGSPAPVNYDYNYLSYSAGINYRIAEPLAVFARYSRGARANADKILFTPMVSTTSGALLNSDDGYDVVKQAEGGVKFRKDGLTLNLTGFLADVEDTNLQSGSATTTRKYHAYGLEFEGAIHRGPFSLTAGATYTDAEIRSDAVNAAVKGMTPRHQPSLIFTAMPQVETRWFTVGANLTGITESYALDVNQLKMPGFTLVDAFVQFRPTDRLQVMVNANNLFDTVGFYEISQNTVPANGIGWGRSANGRTISASVKLDF